MRTLLAFVILFFVVAFARPTYAQDATAEATVEAGQVTVIDGAGGDTNITVESPDTPAPIEKPSFFSSILEFALGALVGAGIMLGSAAAWIRAAMQDPVKMTLAETAARSISPEVLKQVLEFLDTSRAFVTEATDGVPMITKPRPDTGFTTTPADNLKS
jgi:hypothetical protein